MSVYSAVLFFLVAQLGAVGALWGRESYVEAEGSAYYEKEATSTASHCCSLEHYWSVEMGG